MSRQASFHKQSGNAGVLALLVLVVVAVGAFAYFKFQQADAGPGAQAAAVQPAAGDPAPVPAAADTSVKKAADDAAPQIKPGNPVVAKVDGKDITRLDVLNFIQTLPPQTRQMPIEQLFPLAVDQLVNTQIIVSKTKDVKLDDDPEVKKQLDLAKQNIERNVYLQQQVEKQITDAKLKEAYDAYVKGFPKDVQEVKAAHILVKDEAKAKDLIKQLDGGADFAKLAQENSIDGTAKNGGEIGYFAEKEVLPDFAKAAFATPVGSYTKTPVKTDYGYHIIKVLDKRTREPAKFEEAKPFLQVQLRRAILEDMIKNWRKDSKIETFDINGDPVKK